MMSKQYIEAYIEKIDRDIKRLEAMKLQTESRQEYIKLLKEKRESYIRLLPKARPERILSKNLFESNRPRFKTQERRKNGKYVSEELFKRGNK